MKGQAAGARQRNIQYMDEQRRDLTNCHGMNPIPVTNVHILHREPEKSKTGDAGT